MLGAPAVVGLLGVVIEDEVVEERRRKRVRKVVARGVMKGVGCCGSFGVFGAVIDLALEAGILVEPGERSSSALSRADSSRRASAAVAGSLAIAGGTYDDVGSVFISPSGALAAVGEPLALLAVVAAEMRFCPATESWSSTGMLPRNSSMPSVTEL